MKKIMTIFISLLFVGYCANIYATDSDAAKKILLHRLSKLAPNDTARLDILYQLRRVAENPQVETYYSNKLLKEAEAMNNSKYICKAYLSFMIIGYNRYDYQEVNRWMKKLEPLAEKEKLYDELFVGKRCAIDVLQLTEEFEREEREAEKMLQDAQKLQNVVGIITGYMCLSNAYQATYRHREAIDVLKKAYDVAVKAGDESYIIETARTLFAVYQSLGDQANWLKWTKILDNYLDQIIKKEPTSVARLRGWLLLTYISYLSYYTVTESWQQAEKYLHLAEQHVIEGYGTYNYNYYRARYTYFVRAGNLDKALIEVEHIIELFKNLSPDMYCLFVFEKARLCRDLDRMDESLACYKQAFAISDSIKISIINKQTQQLKKDYNADQLLLEKEKIDRNTQLVFLILLLVVFIILVLFIIHTYRVRIYLKKSENEMRRMAKEMEQANAAKELFLSTISSAISIPMNKVVDGSMALASDTVTDMEERIQLSESINKTSTQLMELINNILDLSRIEAGMMKYREEDVDILMVIHNLIDTLPATIRERLVISVPQSVGFIAHIDVVRLQEIFNNLILTSPGNMSLKIELLDNESRMQICIIGSILSSGQQLQEISIANEVNRLLTEHFGGRYEVSLENNSVCLVIPLLQK